MSSYTKTYNDKEGSNRIRFEKLSERFRKVDVDVIHRVSSTTSDKNEIALLPNDGISGSYFRDQLLHFKDLESTNHFKRFCYKTLLLASSLDELVRNIDIIVDKLIKSIEEESLDEIGVYLSLISALGQDLEEHLFSKFHMLFPAILSIIDRSCSGKSPNPDVAGKVFECLSYLLKYQSEKLVDEPDLLRPYYGPLLGHNSKLAREFSAKSLSIIIRKITLPKFKKHMKKLIVSSITSFEEFDICTLSIPPFESVDSVKGENGDLLSKSKRQFKNAMEGLALLLFYSCKGVKGQFHSKGLNKIECILQELCLSRTNRNNETTRSLVSADDKQNVRSLVTGTIISFLIPKLFRHLLQSNAHELWIIILNSLKSFSENYKSFLQDDAVSDDLQEAFVLSLSYLVCSIHFGLTYANGRSVQNFTVRDTISKPLIIGILSLLDLLFVNNRLFSKKNECLFNELRRRCCELFCRIWILYPTDNQLNTSLNNFISIIVSEASIIQDIGTSKLVTMLTNQLDLRFQHSSLIPSLLKQLSQSIISNVSVCDQKVYFDLIYTVLLTIDDDRLKGVDMRVRPDTKQVHGLEDIISVDNNDWEYDENQDCDSDIVDVDSGRRRNEDNRTGGTITTESILITCRDLYLQLTLTCLNKVSEVFIEKKKRVNLCGSIADIDNLINDSTSVYFTSTKILLWNFRHLYDIFEESTILETSKQLTLTFNRYLEQCANENEFLYRLSNEDENLHRLGPSDILTLRLMILIGAFCALQSVVNRDSLHKHLKLLLNAVTSMPASIQVTIALLEYLEYYLIGFNIPKDEFSLDMILSDEELDSLLFSLGRAVSTPSHWLRYNLLTILSYCPIPELSGLIDEDGNAMMDTSETEKIDIVRIFIQAINLPINISSERDFSRYLGNLEVVVRSGRLPAVYARIVCGFCFGVFHIKFQPYWEPACLVLKSAFTAYDKDNDFLWSLYFDQLSYVSSSTMDIDIDGLESNSMTARDRIQATLNELILKDSGRFPFSQSSCESSLFDYQISSSVCIDKQVLVQVDSRTDNQTVYTLTWNILRRCPQITLQRSKIIVPMFFDYLSNHYYAYHHDDVDYALLVKLGVVNANQAQRNDSVEHGYSLSFSMLRKRLEMFLQIFKEVSSPKQLYQHKLLYQYYLTLVSRPEPEIVRLAVECLFTFKENYLVTYKESIMRLCDEKTLREELLSFKLTSDKADGSIAPQHRDDFIPFVVRLVYSKIISTSKQGKSAREHAYARRTAILSFLSQLSSAELTHFSHLIYRGLIPTSTLLQINIDLSPENLDKTLKSRKRGSVPAVTLTSSFVDWYKHIDQVIDDSESNMFESISWPRLVGYLHLLEKIIKVIGFGLGEHIHQHIVIVTNVLIHSHSYQMKQRSDHNTEILINDEEEVEMVDERDEFLNEGIVNDQQTVDDRRHLTNAARVRTMSLLRLSDLVNQYHSTYDFSYIMAKKIFPAIETLIRLLPLSMKSRRAPALLRVIDSLINHDETISIVANNQVLCETIIKCIGYQGIEIEIVRMIISSLTMLLQHNSGESMLPHSQLIIESFTKRFLTSSKSVNDIDADSEEIKLTDVKINPSASIKQELKLLCEIAENLFHRNDVQVHEKSIKNLGTLLLSMLRTYTLTRKIRIEDVWLNNILRIYQTLIQRIQDISNHMVFISRLFGPANHSFSLFNTVSVRNALLNVYEAMTKHPSTMNLTEPSFEAMKMLLAQDNKILDSRDFEKVLSVFRGLSEDSSDPSTISWTMILGDRCKSKHELSICTAVVFECFRCLYDSELIIRGAALSSLKNLINNLLHWIDIDDFMMNDDDSVSMSSIKAMELFRNILLPYIRQGIKQSNESTKRVFVQLLSFVISRMNEVKHLSRYRSLFLNECDYHTDLSFLLHEDPEQNFFENILHIQLHRRIRAISKLRTFLKDVSQSANIDTSSKIHVLLPLAFYPILSDEYTKKDHMAYMQESAMLLGTISLSLPWSHYYYILKQLLSKLEKLNEQKETALITALCATLDNFHFPLTVTIHSNHNSSGMDDEETMNDDQEDPEDAAANEVGDSELTIQSHTERESMESAMTAEKPSNMAAILLRSIFPWVKVFLLKDTTDQHGERSKEVRPPIAVVLAKIIHQLQPPIVIARSERETIFRNLIMTIISTLRSRDVSSRDIARQCLVKIIQTIGIRECLSTVLYEMSSSLIEGYQRHVCSYTVRYILAHVLEDYQPPKHYQSFTLDQLTRSESIPSSLADEIQSGPLDECLDMIMDIVIDDLTGITQQDRDVSDANRSLIREAKGLKSYEILQLCGKHLYFHPMLVMLDPNHPTKHSSIHKISNRLIDLLIQSQYHENLSLLNRISEGLYHLSIGLTTNPSIQAQEMLLYLHATFHPFILKLIKNYIIFQHSQGMIQITGKLPDMMTLNTIVDDIEDNQLIEMTLPSYLNEGDDDDDDERFLSQSASNKKTKNDVKGFKPSIWLTDLNQKLTSKYHIYQEKKLQSKKLYEVQDGVNAPKLTGMNRYEDTNRPKSLSRQQNIDSGTLIAMKYCLNLFYLCLKKNLFRSNNSSMESDSMIDVGDNDGGSRKAAVSDIDSSMKIVDDTSGSSESIKTMMTSFMPLFGYCLKLPNHSDILSLNIKCLSEVLSREYLPMEYFIDHPQYLTILSNTMLRLIVQGHGLITSDNELVQSCMKGLTIIFQTYHQQSSSSSSSSTSLTPLHQNKIRFLIQYLISSVLSIPINHQNTAYHLIKSLIHMKIMIPEIYDLINIVMKQIVLSSHKTVRDLCSHIVISFIVNYPLSQKRFGYHVNQLLMNCHVESFESRLSAYGTIFSLIKILPMELITGNNTYQIIFFQLINRLIHETKHECNELIKSTVQQLFMKIDSESMIVLLQYTIQWFQTNLMNESPNPKQESFNNNNLTKRGFIDISSQVLCILMSLSSKKDLIKKYLNKYKLIELIRNHCFILLIESTYHTLVYQSNQQIRTLTISDQIFNEKAYLESDNNGQDPNWRVLYHLLLFLESLLIHSSTYIEHELLHLPVLPEECIHYIRRVHGVNIDEDVINKVSSMNNIVSESMLYPHVLLRGVSCRIFVLMFRRRNPVTLLFQSSANISKVDKNQDFLIQENALYDLGRKFCIVLNQPYLMESVLNSAIEGLVFLIQAMYHNPHLCKSVHNDDYNDASTTDVSAIDDVEEDVDEEEENDVSSEKDDEVFSTFDDSRSHGADWVMERLRHIGTDKRGLRRLYVIKVFKGIVEKENKDFTSCYLRHFMELCIRNEMTVTGPNEQQLKQIKDESTEFLQQVEMKIGSSEFLEVYALIQKRLHSNRMEKKRSRAMKALTDPKEYAIEKMTKRRRVNDTEKATLQSHAIRIIKDPKELKSRHSLGSKQKTKPRKAKLRI